MKCGANEKNFKGYLIAYMGDTPAANLAGGFKVGVGGAYSCCRSCRIKYSNLCLQVK